MNTMKKGSEECVGQNDWTDIYLRSARNGWIVRRNTRIQGEWDGREKWLSYKDSGYHHDAALFEPLPPWTCRAALIAQIVWENGRILKKGQIVG